MPDGADHADRREDSVVPAAGAVVWRPGTPDPEIALVHRPKYDDWSHPKGKCEPGEHVLSTAIREVVEETGLRVILGRPLGPSVYRVNGGTKRVRYWAGRRVESLGFIPGAEIDEVIWLPVTEARDRLSYPRDVALLDEFLAGPAEAVPFILLRHATAGSRAATDAGDLARPLDADGSAEASLLTSLLSCFGPCRVISSAAERCLATVRPYAAVVGLPVEVEPAFSVPVAVGLTGVGRTPEQARQRASQRVAELAAAGTPTLVCAHRENLPDLLAALCDALGAKLPQGLPLERGAFWVLQTADGALVSAEQHRLAE